MLIAKIPDNFLQLFSPVSYYLESKNVDGKKSGKKMKKSSTFLLMTLKINYIILYLLISGFFSNSGKFRTTVSKSETDLFSVSEENPASLDTFRRFRTEKPSKIKDFSHSVYSLEP